MLLCAATAMAQGAVRGRVFDKKSDEPVAYATVKVAGTATSQMAGGGMTDEDGRFSIGDLPYGDYSLTVSIVGYRDIVRRFSLDGDHAQENFSRLFMSEDSKLLDEVTVTGQKSTMKLEVDRKSFDVGQLISNAGQAASDVLDNIPSVEVDNDGNISLRGNTSVEVWVNGRSSGLTTDNRAQILQQLPAESIERIEVIDNPSAKFSAEGSAGIINIVLKKDRTPGYYGSVQVGGTTRKGANSSFNINYSSGKLDAFLNVGFRHRTHDGSTESNQEYTTTGTYQRYEGDEHHEGNNLFSRAGLTYHITGHDEVGVNGMFMFGGGKNRSDIPYHYGVIGGRETSLMTRATRSNEHMNGFNAELTYRHSFSDTHFIDFSFSGGRWKMDNDNIYKDSTLTYGDDGLVAAREYSYQLRPMHVNNRNIEIKLDYENKLSEQWKLEAGYQARLGHENTPQESFVGSTWNGSDSQEDKLYFNRFIYDNNIHALYATLSCKIGQFSFMGGLRGEYWRVNTESLTWEQEYAGAAKDKPFKKDYFELFPSLFMSYQITDNDQLQLNVTRRLRRPWGGELNSFKDTRDATTVSFGNPELTPEFSNSFALNYLRTWTEHSLLLSAYYRPTTDVMQRVQWQNETDGKIYQTSKNVARSLSSGMELTVKNKLLNILDLTTNVNAYYYKLNGFDYEIEGQQVHGDGNHNFTWNARITASLILPYDISIQGSCRYRARQVTAQGHSNANCSMDMGMRKNFFNKLFTLSVNCRDVFNSRSRTSVTETEQFTRYQRNKWGSRTVSVNLVWNFGNMKGKKRDRHGDDAGEMQMDSNTYSGNSEE